MLAGLHALSRSARLLYWLGPWSPKTSSPGGVSVRAVAGLPAGSRLYAPVDGVARGAILISPGLHYDGPADPRMDRLARILATAGFVTLSPASPSLMAMQLRPAAIATLEHALEALLSAPERPLGVRPAIFSVSVGSLAALTVAASARFQDAVSRVIVFGGYADPTALMRALTVDARDPLNRPTALLTLLEHVPGAPRGADLARLHDSFRAYLRATWPCDELKIPGGDAHHPIARMFAAELPARLSRWFLVGTGVLGGAWELCEAAFAAARPELGYLDPRAQLAGLRCPITIVHGAGDHVIPSAQAAALEAALPPGLPCQRVVTGMYAHSSASFSYAATELARFGRIFRALDNLA